jgi:hypothetical protein
VDSALRYIGGAVGFGFGAMWMTVGIGAAIACLLLAALGYGVVLLAERAQANGIAQRMRRPEETYDFDVDLPLTADELELSRAPYEPESYDEPPVEAPVAKPAPVPVAARADYGWPV